VFDDMSMDVARQEQEADGEEEGASGPDDDDGEMEDPIVDVVDMLRQQRMLMVQGEQQFWFLYDILRELWLQRYRARQ